MHRANARAPQLPIGIVLCAVIRNDPVEGCLTAAVMRLWFDLHTDFSAFRRKYIAEQPKGVNLQEISAFFFFFFRKAHP